MCLGNDQNHDHNDRSCAALLSYSPYPDVFVPSHSVQPSCSARRPARSCRQPGGIQFSFSLQEKMFGRLAMDWQKRLLSDYIMMICTLPFCASLLQCQASCSILQAARRDNITRQAMGLPKFHPGFQEHAFVPSHSVQPSCSARRPARSCRQTAGTHHNDGLSQRRFLLPLFMPSFCTLPFGEILLQCQASCSILQAARREVINGWPDA